MATSQTPRTPAELRSQLESQLAMSSCCDDVYDALDHLRDGVARLNHRSQERESLQQLIDELARWRAQYSGA